MAVNAGLDRAASGANYFAHRKALRRKGLRCEVRKKYESTVDNCLELGIMAGAKKSEDTSQEPE